MLETHSSKVRRLLRGVVADALESIENRNALLVMREAAREIEREIDDAKSEIGNLASRRLIATKQEAAAQIKIDELTEKAKFALQEGRRDLAEALLARQLDIETNIPKLAAIQKDASERESARQQALAGLETRKQEMDADIAAISSSIANATALSEASPARSDNPQARSEAASQAFDRAKSTLADCATLPSATPDAAKKIAEIDALLRQRELADRMAKLQASTREAKT
jgi:phage shock protein A